MTNMLDRESSRRRTGCTSGISGVVLSGSRELSLKYWDLGMKTTQARCKMTSNRNIHFEMILDVGIGEKRKETKFLI